MTLFFFFKNWTYLGNEYRRAQASALFASFGQFLSHDLTMAIEMPPGDTEVLPNCCMERSDQMNMAWKNI